MTHLNVPFSSIHLSNRYHENLQQPGSADTVSVLPDASPQQTETLLNSDLSEETQLDTCAENSVTKVKLSKKLRQTLNVTFLYFLAKDDIKNASIKRYHKYLIYNHK